MFCFSGWLPWSLPMGMWHKLNDIQQDYEALGYIGKKQVIQRCEETFEYRDILNFFAESGGKIEIDG